MAEQHTQKTEKIKAEKKEHVPVVAQRPSRRALVQRIGISALILALVAGGWWYVTHKDIVSIENALVNAPITNLSPSTAGTLKQVLVADGDMVQKGTEVAIVGSETLHAYTDGVVTSTNKSFGSLASAQTPVVTMVSRTEMRIDGTIDENKGLNKLKIGQPVSFTIDALPGKTYWGYIDEIAESAKQTQAAFSISSERPVQQFEVYVRFDTTAYPTIKNGMSAKMTVHTRMP